MEIDQKDTEPLVNRKGNKEEPFSVHSSPNASSNEQDIDVTLAPAEQILQLIVHEIVNASLEQVSNVDGIPKYESSIRSKIRDPI
jgi:hypothetical protein